MFDQSRFETLAADLEEDRLTIEYLSPKTLPPALSLGDGERCYAPGSHTRARLHGEPLASLEMLLAARSTLPPLAETRVVLGTARDPFFPGITSLPRALRALEMLADAEVGSLLIQTRSPLCLLALPVLRRFREIEIRLCLETADRELEARMFPAFPRAAERLEAARALSRARIPCSLQLAPAVRPGEAQRKLVPLAERVAALELPVRIVPFASLLSKERSTLAAKSRRDFYGLAAKLHPEAHRLLRNELAARNALAPLAGEVKDAIEAA